MASVKIDVIYYKTSSDFEFEFNLSGCAGIRLFKEKAESPKGLVTSLARDVARSKVIIVVTDLDTENSCINTLSKAIGLPVVLAQKETYNIKSQNDCHIFSGATPLVTKSGEFVGFISESGPQSIIVLTSDRALRHEIMDTYVHKYIFNVAQVDAYNKKYSISAPEPTPIPIPADTPVTEAEENADNQSEQVMEDISSVQEIDIAPGTTIIVPKNEEPENTKELDARLPKRKNTTNIILLVIVVLLLIAFGILAYLFIYIPLLNGETHFLSGAVNYFLRR